MVDWLNPYYSQAYNPSHVARNHQMRRTPLSTPLSAAFSTTFAAGLFLVTGLIGYSLSHGFFEGTWTDGIVWWEIRFGIVFALFAVYFWRKAFRSLA